MYLLMSIVYNPINHHMEVFFKIGVPQNHPSHRWPNESIETNGFWGHDLGNLQDEIHEKSHSSILITIIYSYSPKKNI